MSRRKRARPRQDDEEVIGALLAEVVERRRAGEHPSAGEYSARHPKLASTIARHFATIEFLESAGAAPSGSGDLSTAIAALPEPLQRLVYLRQFERLAWSEIAGRLAKPEAELRKEHARALRHILERCGDWLERFGEA